MNADKSRRRRRLWLIAAALLAIVVGGLALWVAATGYCWVGRKELTVIVRIADVDTAKPLQGVPLTVFNGPLDALDSPLPMVSEAASNPDAESAYTQRFTTGDEGSVHFTRKFFAAGNESTFGHSGYVKLAGTWIEAAPVGYSSVVIPIDGQSSRPRDIEDETPVFVTILLRKPKDNSTPSGQQEHAR